MAHAPPVNKTGEFYHTTHILGSTNTGLATRAGGGSSSKTKGDIGGFAGTHPGLVSK